MSTLIEIDSPEISEEDKISLSKQISNIDTKINLVFLSPSTATKKDLDDIDDCFKKIESLYHHMEVELSSYSQSTKVKYNMPFYKSKLLKIKKQIQEIQFLTKGFLEIDSEDEAKEKLISANKDLDEGNEKMEDAIKLIRNVNETDKNTMTSLKTQTNTIQNATDILNQADAYVKRSGKYINSMINNALANRVILICIIIILGLIDVFILYYKKFKN